jgi:ABC-type Fe3+-hydroxamate transport system substrate-binding protein
MDVARTPRVTRSILHASTPPIRPRPRGSALVLLVASALAPALAACGDEVSVARPSSSAAATSDTSAIATARAAPRRVVAFTCAAVDILNVLGMLDRVVAVEEDCPAPGTEHAVKIRNDDHPGQVHVVQVEAILATRPDLVIAKGDLKDAFEGRGMRMLWAPPVVSMETLPGFVRDIAAAMGVPERGEEALARMGRIEAEIRSRTAGLAPVRVYYETNGVGRTAGRPTIVDAMITLAGGRNVAGDEPRPSVQWSAEAVIAADPEVIVLGTWAPPVEEVIARPGWDRISAVKNGRVHRIPEERRYGTFGSPRCVEVCRDLWFPWIHPEAAAKATWETK